LTFISLSTEAAFTLYFLIFGADSFKPGITDGLAEIAL
jgi:hypothetical protein